MRLQPLLDGEKLSLTNEGQLEVFFLGTGSAFSQNLGNTNFLLVKGQEHLLVDFGVTGPTRLWDKARLRPTDIDSLLLTHVHADHCGGVEQLAFMNRFIAKKKPTLWAPEPFLGPLWNNTLSGGMKYLTGSPNPLRLGDYFTIQKLWDEGQFNEHYAFTHGSMEVEVFRTNHVETPHDEPEFQSYGICIDDRLFFSGDSTFDVRLIGEWSHCEALFHDCSLYPSGGTHAEMKDLQMLIPEVKGKTYLVHLADNYKDHDICGFAGWVESGVRYIFD